MMQTIVFQRDGDWYFRWRNFMDRQMPMAQDFDGPFATRDEAERVRQDFVAARAARYPGESIGIR
jgi:hypothetical protein